MPQRVCGRDLARPFRRRRPTHERTGGAVQRLILRGRRDHRRRRLAGARPRLNGLRRIGNSRRLLDRQRLGDRLHGRDRRGLGCGHRRRRGLCNRRRIGHRRRHGLGGGRRRRLHRDRRHERGGRGDARGQERQRVEVPLRVVSSPDAQVDVGLRHLGVAARTDRADDGALRDGCIARDGDRAEVRERHRVAVSGRDRDALPRRGHAAREGDAAGGGRKHRRAGVTADIHPAVLAGRVWVGRVEDERLQDGAGGGPRPGLARRREEERGEDRRKELTTHGDRLSDRGFMNVSRRGRARCCCQRSERTFTVEPGLRCCQTRLQSCHREPR